MNPDRQTNWLRVMALVTVVCVVGSLFLLYGRVSTQTRRSQITGYSNCLRLNDGRRRLRQVNADDIAILFNATVPGSAARTPETQKFLTDLMAEVDARNAVVLKLVNCDTAAPLPSGMSNNERKLLPRPEPIPPLRLP